MSNLRNDPDGHLEVGLRVEIARNKGEIRSEEEPSPAWAAFAEALLEDAIAWNERGIPMIKRERERWLSGAWMLGIPEPKP